MKKTLPLSRIPNDIKYRLGLVTTRLEDAMALLTSIDPVAFPGGELDSLIDAVLDARARRRAAQAVRPRKRTEVALPDPDAAWIVVFQGVAPDAHDAAVPDAV